MRRPLLPPLLFSVRLPTLLVCYWRKHRGWQASLSVNTRDRRHFIVFRLDGLGDVLLTSPLFRELKRAYPGSRMTVVVQKHLRSLLATNPYVDDILPVPDLSHMWLPARCRNLLAALLLYARSLRGRSFDVAINPRWDTDEHLATLMCALTNAREYVGYSENVAPVKQRLNRGFDRAYTLLLPAGPVQHEVLRSLAVAEALGCRIEDRRVEVRLTQLDRQAASRGHASGAAGSKLVALGIGAASPSRCWPLERYAAVVKQLEQQYDVRPVIVCSHGERHQAQRLADSLGAGATVLGGAPLREVCALLERCDLFLGNDSGPAHLSAAMNCKTLVISRHPLNGDPNHPNSPVRFAPYSPRARVLQPLEGMDKCGTCCVSRRPHCITGVSVEEVVSRASQMLAEVPGDLADSLVSPARFKSAFRPQGSAALSQAAIVANSTGVRPQP